MSRSASHVSETRATQFLRRHGVAFSEHVYDYVEHGGTAESARQLGVPEREVVKTLVMQDERAQPLVVLMHGDRSVSRRNEAPMKLRRAGDSNSGLRCTAAQVLRCGLSLKNLARAIGCKKVEPCTPDTAQRHSGYQVGGTSPFGLRKAMPIYAEAGVLELPRVYLNGGRRGYLVGIEPGQVVRLLGAREVRCASAE